MTKKEFINIISNGREDIVEVFLNLLNYEKISYCVIGGLGVNAYVEPVVSLDLDIVIISDEIDQLIKKADKYFKIERFPYSINLNNPQSDLRIQIQTDPRYQEFINKATKKDVMGYEMNVAAVEDILRGKIWAYSDKQRRKSKRQKDLADIFRIIEEYPKLKKLIPSSMKHIEF